MRAIRTRYSPQTVRWPAAVNARAASAGQLRTPLDPALSREENHRAAALALCKKLNWGGLSPPAQFGDDYYWPCAPAGTGEPIYVVVWVTPGPKGGLMTGLVEANYEEAISSGVAVAMTKASRERTYIVSPLTLYRNT